jgi:hypothetical protein
MISKWLSANEIAELISIDIRSSQRRAKKEHWISRKQSVRGGKQSIYQLAALPEDIQTAYAASIKVSLTELQSQLKPSTGHQRKINIPRYNGRGAKTKEIKTIEMTADSDLKIAAARRQLIEAYNDSGLSVAQFIRSAGLPAHLK